MHFEYFLKNVLFGRSPVYRVDFPTARFGTFWRWWYRGDGIREGGTSWYNAVKGVVYREPVALSPLSPPSRNKIEKINRNKIRNFLKFKNLPRFKDFGSIDIWLADQKQDNFTWFVTWLTITGYNSGIKLYLQCIPWVQGPENSSFKFLFCKLRGQQAISFQPTQWKPQEISLNFRL